MLVCEYVFTTLMYDTLASHVVAAASAIVVTLIFIWLSFRSGRWWPLAATSALVLCAMVFVLEWLNPSLSRYAAVSARIGLWMVVYLALLAGVAERWLAGERAVSGTAVWRRRSEVS